MNSQEWQGLREQDLWGETDNIKRVMNARFVLADMTDYEDDFPSINEVSGFEIENRMAIQNLLQTWPQTDCRAVDIEEMEKYPALGTGSTHKQGVLDRIEAAEMGEEEEEDEDEDDEDEDEEGDEEGEGGDDEGEEEEEEEEDDDGVEDPLQLPSPRQVAPPEESRYFMHDETMRESFNEVELDSFMKLLNVKPVPQWEETSTHHYKVGTHAYEDEAQELDPYFHLLAEVERKHAERHQAFEWRKGSEIKFVLDPRKTPVYGSKQHYNVFYSFYKLKTFFKKKEV